MIHFLDFCKYYIPENQNHDIFDLYRLDLENHSYSVMTRTFEDIFHFLNPKMKKKHFKFINEEEKLGSYIYLSFIRLMIDFIEENRDEILNIEREFQYQVSEKENDFELEHLFFRKSGGINLLANIERNDKNESFTHEMNQSIFFNILFRKERIHDKEDFSFEKCYKLLIRYIFSCELYRNVSREISKCKRLYHDNFILHLPYIQYAEEYRNEVTVEEYVEQMESIFLGKCERGIYNIQYATEPTMFSFDQSLYHLDYREVRNKLHEQIQDEKLSDRKLKFYFTMIEADMIIWKKFDVFEDWLIDLVYDIFMKYPVDELKVTSIKSFYKNFFSGNVMRSNLVCYQSEKITEDIRDCTNRKEFFVRNYFPNYFMSFSIRKFDPTDHHILQTLLNFFPLDVFNFNHMNFSLWYIINVIELYRFYQDRNYAKLENFQGASFIQTINRSCVISFSSFLHVVRKKYGFIDNKKSFLFDFTDLLRNLFQKFFVKNLKKKLNLYEVRKEYIEKKFEWKEMKNDKLYEYFCMPELDLFEKTLENERNEMKKYSIVNAELFSERMKYCILYFIQEILDKKDTIKNGILFTVELLTGIELQNVEGETWVEMFSSVLKELDYYVSKDDSMIYNFSIHESLFYGKSYLRKNFENFIKFLKKVEFDFFPIEEKNHHIEEVIYMRIKMLLEKNIWKLLS